MPHLVWTDRARRDLLRLGLFLQEVNPDAAPRAIAKIRQELFVLQEFPELGRPVLGTEHSREWVIRFGRAAYIVLYNLDENVVIRSVRHSREVGY